MCLHCTHILSTTLFWQVIFHFFISAWSFALFSFLFVACWLKNFVNSILTGTLIRILFFSIRRVTCSVLARINFWRRLNGRLCSLKRGRKSSSQLKSPEKLEIRNLPLRNNATSRIRLMLQRVSRFFFFVYLHSCIPLLLLENCPSLEGHLLPP